MISNIWTPISDIWVPLSDIWVPISHVQYLYPTSDMQHLTRVRAGARTRARARTRISDVGNILDKSVSFCLK